MIARRVAPLALVLAVAIAGCATQADVQELEREQKRLRTQMADTRAGVDSMQRDVAKVRGGVDEVRYSSRGAGSVTTRLDDLEARVAALEGHRPAPAASPIDGTSTMISVDGSGATPVPVPTATPAPPRPEIAASDLSKEEAKELPDDYRRGITLVRQGAYDKAIQSLRDFLRTNRESPLAPNAPDASSCRGSHRGSNSRRRSGTDRVPAGLVDCAPFAGRENPSFQGPCRCVHGHHPVRLHPRLDVAVPGKAV